MEKKNLLFVAAAMVMAGCASDDMIGDNATTQSDNQVIGFNMNVPATTRGTVDGKLTEGDAASKLNNTFYVWGEKDEATNPSTATSADNLVFKNYKVTWTDNTANTTLSNTKNWEYVGVTPVTSGVTPKIESGKSQTIKYWDMNATSYTFTAISALTNDIESGNVAIAKTETGNTGYRKGYTITLKSGANTGNIYFADRVNLVKNTVGTTTNNEEGKYGGFVKFTFRNFQTKIRFGFYETVPGYKVQVKNVTYGGSTSTTTFGVNSNFYSVPTDGSTITYNVVYEDGTNNTTANKATVEVGTATAATSMAFGENLISTDSKSIDLATTSASPTYDQTGGAYKSILPNPSNGIDMTFKISYTLISEDTGEKIEVTNKDVVVPVEYCKWKPNYAYTYLFKISDKSADLYPITFDACVVEEQIGNQETITEVGGETETVSITTYGYDDTNKQVVTGKNEYEAGNVIYASIMEGATPAVVTKTTLESKAKLYTVEASTDQNYKGTAVKPTITEAAVANCIANSKSGVADLTGGILTITQVTKGVEYVDEVPAEDGTKRTLAAMKWTAGDSGTTYAIQYEGTDGKMYYKIVKIQ